MVRLTLDAALSKRNVTRYELAKRTGIQYQVIDNYYKNKVKRYDSFVLDRICEALNCKINDIMEYEFSTKNSTESKSYERKTILKCELITYYTSFLKSLQL